MPPPEATSADSTVAVQSGICVTRSILFSEEQLFPRAQQDRILASHRRSARRANKVGDGREENAQQPAIFLGLPRGWTRALIPPVRKPSVPLFARTWGHASRDGGSSSIDHPGIYRFRRGRDPDASHARMIIAPWWCSQTVLSNRPSPRHATDGRALLSWIRNGNFRTVSSAAMQSDSERAQCCPRIPGNHIQVFRCHRFLRIRSRGKFHRLHRVRHQWRYGVSRGPDLPPNRAISREDPVSPQFLIRCARCCETRPPLD